VVKKILLSVAGYDPTSGAGVLLDVNVFRFLDFMGMAILTSVTSQNTKAVNEIHSLPPEFLWSQYQSVKEDFALSGIKVGMVASKENIQVVARILSQHSSIPRVIDPVFKSSSGQWLTDRDALSTYIRAIKGKATLLTPNLEEAALISRDSVRTADEMKEAAEKIYQLTRIPCLVKGGHLPEQKIDILFDGKDFYALENKEVRKRVHGTGCFFSSSLLAYLVKGNPLDRAFFLASKLTHRAIREAVAIDKGQHIISFPF
jgi:hydroxymethylpyrimidine kinase/phosphomethylpyrimidine kinase